ncbi:MAG TPA: UDP-N-acetylmuramate dehydrogenase [Nakamurella sp.]|nr:UDP-N-acetylmuramate dehydrogenase [Nakamurella sp.]
MSTTAEPQHPPAAAPGGGFRLSDLTTIGLGGPAPAVHTATTADQVAALVGDGDAGGGVLVLGGGSNLVVADAGVAVPVVRVGIRGLDVRPDPASDGREATVTIGAGEDWDPVVAALVEEGWTGVESLSGIPGSAGATPVQNVGAYGTEISDVLVDVQVYDRRSAALRTLSAAALRLGYRNSALRGTDAAVVTAIRLRLRRDPRPVRYAELARALGVAVGDPAPAADVRQAVLDLRRAKGMVLDPQDPDTRSVGSFFTNPVLSDDELAMTEAAVTSRFGADVPFPRYPAVGGTKLSAAWLIERAGFGRGFPLGEDPAARIAVSGKHTLALTNRGGGTTAELVTLARRIRDGVRDAFGVTLRPEPVLVGVTLDDNPG